MRFSISFVIGFFEFDSLARPSHWSPDVLFFISIVLAGAGLTIFFRECARLWDRLYPGREQVELRGVRQAVQLVQEVIEVGLVPSAEQIQKLDRLPPPWGGVVRDALTELRASGASVLPTLRRFQALALVSAERVSMARSKMAQSFTQAGIGLALAPGFGLALYYLLPQVQQAPGFWVAGVTGAIIFDGLGVAWMLLLAERARWGGLGVGRRSWILLLDCSVERFVSSVRAGQPPDLAWSRCYEWLLGQSQEFSGHWGPSVWAGDGQSLESSGLASRLVQAAAHLRRSIQASVMEGRSCLAAVESEIQTVRKEVGLLIEKEMNLLAVRALQPLFICVAPSLFGLLAFGLYLGWDPTF